MTYFLSPAKLILFVLAQQSTTAYSSESKRHQLDSPKAASSAGPIFSSRIGTDEDDYSHNKHIIMSSQDQKPESNGSNGNVGGGGIASRLARKNILELQPYRCARDDYSEGILLDANENAFGPPLDFDDDVLERYPDPYQVPLKLKYAAYRGYDLQPSNIFVGVGSDEAIDLLMRIFCQPGQDKILTTPPTYGMYKVCAKVNDVDIVNVPLTPNFDVRISEVRTRR